MEIPDHKIGDCGGICMYCVPEDIWEEREKEQEE